MGFPHRLHAGMTEGVEPFHYSVLKNALRLSRTVQIHGTLAKQVLVSALQ